MNLIAAWPRMMDPDQALSYVGGPTILEDLKRKKLVSPRVERKGLTRYDRHNLDAALDAWKGLTGEDSPTEQWRSRRRSTPRASIQKAGANAPRLFLNGRQLAKAMNVSQVFVTAMKAAGYMFPYQHQTTLEHALKWREEHPHFRYSDYEHAHCVLIGVTTPSSATG